MPPELTVLDGALSPEIKFNLLSREGEFISADVGANGKKVFRGVASSTTRDLHGDVILKSALDDMERTAVGMTIFLNHSYEVPEDVGGTCVKAIVKQKGVDQDGEPNWQLEVESEVEEENERALKSWRMIRNGRKLGISIGAMIPKGGAVRQKDGSYIIEHIQLLEYSIVGIPANPKSWVEYAASALRVAHKAQTTQLGNPTLTLDGDKYRIEGSLQGLELNLGVDAPEGEEVTVTTTVTYDFSKDAEGKTIVWRNTQIEGDENIHAESLGAWDFADPDEKVAALATVGLEDVIEKATVWVETRDGDKITIGEPESTDSGVTAEAEPDTTLAACPTCGKGKASAGCDDAYHKDVEPEVTDAKVRIIEVDTDSPESSGDGQGASSSEPDGTDTLSADPETGTEPVILDELTEGQLIQLSFRQLQAAALAALRALDEQKRLLGEEKQARVKAEGDRDAVIEATAQLMVRQAAFVEKVANSPLTRRSVARDVREHSASIEAFYGEEFARVLQAPSVRS